MHGAAHTANAPPSRKLEPRRRAPCTSPAPTRRSGHGSNPMNANPNTIRMKPATCSSKNWLRVNERPIAAAPRTEEHEEGHEPGDKREARDDDAPGSAGFAQPLGLDRRHGGEIARNERQHARCEEGDEPGAEGDQDRRGTHSKRASSASRRRSSSGSSGSSPSGGGASSSRRRLQCQASAPTRTAPRRVPQAEAARQASRIPSAGDREHGRPELVDELRLDLALRVAGGDPDPDVRLDAAGGRRVRGVERRLADGAHELGLELGGGWLHLTRGCRARERKRQHREGEKPHAGASARSIPSSMSAASRTGPAMR